MLVEEALLHLRAVSIRTRVAPAVKEVAPLAAAAALVTGCFGGRRAVVDDADLAERENAHHDLVEAGIVGDGIEVGPCMSIR